MIEEWREISDWPDYAISNLGRVKRTTTYGRGIAGTIRKPVLVAGYPAVALTNRDGRRKMLHIHRLVALAFLGDPPSPDFEVNHIDADRLNPRLDNLEWVTKSQNRKHGFDVGYADAKGERNGYSKLTSDQALVIREEGGDRRSWLALAEQYGVSVGTVRDVATGRTWKHLPESGSMTEV